MLTGLLTNTPKLGHSKWPRNPSLLMIDKKFGHPCCRALWHILTFCIYYCQYMGYLWTKKQKLAVNKSRGFHTCQCSDQLSANTETVTVRPFQRHVWYQQGWHQVMGSNWWKMEENVNMPGVRSVLNTMLIQENYKISPFFKCRLDFWNRAGQCSRNLPECLLSTTRFKHDYSPNW